MAGVRIRMGTSVRELEGEGPFTLGRDPDCSVVVNNPYVSRRHAELRFEGGVWILEAQGQGGMTHEGSQASRVSISSPTEVWLGAAGSGERVEIEPVGLVAETRLASPVAPGGALRSGGIVVRLNGQEHRFAGDKDIVVGRLPSADVRTDNPTVSREHLRIRPEGGGWVLESMGQRGTFMDGQPVTRLPITGAVSLTIGDPNQSDRVEIVPDSAGLAGTQVAATRAAAPPATPATVAAPRPAPPAAAPVGVGVPGAAPAPGGAFAKAASGQTSVIRRLVATNRRTTGIALVAALVAIAVGVWAIFFNGSGGGVEGVVKDAGPKTAFIQASGGSGTGWVYNAAQGFIVTNYHVVGGATSVQVTIAGRQRPADVFAVAPCDDLAMLKVNDTSGLEQFNLGSQNDLEAGERVVTLGFPDSLSSTPTLQSNDGTISAVHADDAAEGYPNLIQHNATINAGNSGGPLVDLDGNLIGVNTLVKFQTSEANPRPVQGEFYSIPADRVKELAPTLTAGTDLGHDGIGLESLVVAGTGTSSVLLIAGVESGGPAQQLSPFKFQDGAQGAWVLKSIDGKPISTKGDYCDAIRSQAEGSASSAYVAYAVQVSENQISPPIRGTTRKFTIHF